MAFLPAGLRQHISQRKDRLMEASQAGLKRVPRAIEQLMTNSDTGVIVLIPSSKRPITKYGLYF